MRIVEKLVGDFQVRNVVKIELGIEWLICGIAVPSIVSGRRFVSTLEPTKVSSNLCLKTSVA